MARTNLILKGFKRFKRALNPPRVKSRLAVEVKKANVRIGGFLVDMVRRAIREGSFHGNAELTRVLKNSSLPLVDHGDLLGSVNFSHKGDWIVDIGVKREAGQKQIGGRGSGGKVNTKGSGSNVALIVHEGATIDVTDQMRAYFKFLAHHTKGRVKPLSPQTTQITIRPRPYFRDTVYSPQATQMIQREWMAAIEGAFKPK